MSILLATIVFCYSVVAIDKKRGELQVEKSTSSKSVVMRTTLRNANLYGTTSKYTSDETDFLKSAKKKRINAYLLMAKNGRVVLQTGNGRAKANASWSGYSQFRVADFQKLLTIDLVLQLIRNDKVKLKDTLATLIPQLENTNLKNVTVKDLLTDNKKIYVKSKDIQDKGYYDLLVTFKKNITTSVSDSENINCNFVLLAMIVQSMSKEDYTEYAQNSLLTNSGISHASFVSDGEINKQLAIPYHRSDNAVDYSKPYPTGNYLFGINDLCMSASDMYMLIDNSITKFARGSQSDIFKKSYRAVFGNTSIENSVYSMSIKSDGYELNLIFNYMKKIGIVYNVTSRPAKYNSEHATAEFYHGITGD